MINFCHTYHVFVLIWAGAGLLLWIKAKLSDGYIQCSAIWEIIFCLIGGPLVLLGEYNNKRALLDWRRYRDLPGRLIRLDNRAEEQYRYFNKCLDVQAQSIVALEKKIESKK